MLVKRSVQNQAAIEAVRKELEYLYSRRSAVESLIRSLERYDRSKDKCLAQVKQPA